MEKISICDPVSLKEKKQTSKIKIYPAKHYLVASDVKKKATESIKKELKESHSSTIDYVISATAG